MGMREQMPCVAEWVDRQREQFGATHVNACIKRGLAGEPGQFFAFEGGHVVGTPFEADDVMDPIRIAMAIGGRFGAILRPPVQAKEASHAQ